MKKVNSNKREKTEVKFKELTSFKDVIPRFSMSLPDFCVQTFVKLHGGHHHHSKSSHHLWWRKFLKSLKSICNVNKIRL